MFSLLVAGARACARCGQAFDAPVPATPPTAAAPLGAAASAVAAPARPPAGRKALWWILGILGGIVLLVLIAAVVGYRSFQNALGSSLGRLPGRMAGAGQQGSWVATPALVARLAPPQQVAGPLGFYTVQPPAGFSLHGTNMQAANGKSLIYAWTGPQAADGTAPVFTVMLGSDGGMMTSHLAGL